MIFRSSSESGSDDFAHMGRQYRGAVKKTPVRPQVFCYRLGKPAAARAGGAFEKTDETQALRSQPVLLGNRKHPHACARLAHRMLIGQLFGGGRIVMRGRHIGPSRIAGRLT